MGTTWLYEGYISMSGLYKARDVLDATAVPLSIPVVDPWRPAVKDVWVLRAVALVGYHGLPVAVCENKVWTGDRPQPELAKLYEFIPERDAAGWPCASFPVVKVNLIPLCAI